MSRPHRRPDASLIVLLLVVCGLMAPLWVGFEPVGGDPDRIFRPIKSELAATLAEGTLPLWSDRFGLGIPLVAESHAAAFYPIDVLLYRLLRVSVAYRLSMWLHYVILSAATWTYARRLGITSWGSALAGLAFTFCSMQTIHSSHEWMYHTLPYLVMALLVVDRYAESGERRWLGLLALVLGLQWTLGHFQIQTWTNIVVLIVGTTRIVTTGRPRIRLLGVLAGIVCGVVIAAVQLGPSWELAQFVGMTGRSLADRMFYAFPPAHWIELAIPGLFREVPGGPEAPYWFAQQTTGFESALYVGTIPLILALIGLLGSRSGLGIWKVLAAATWLVATMPRWWPEAYLWLLRIPGIGYYRCPSRYTVLTCLSLSLLAGAGFDRVVLQRWFRLGVVLAFVLGATSFALAIAWMNEWERYLSTAFESIETRLLVAAFVWVIALTTVLAWRRGRLHSAIPFGITALELGILYYTGTTRWDWSVELPGDSPILTRLIEEPEIGLIGGQLDNIPIRAGLTTATPYIGFALPEPNALIKTIVSDPRAVEVPEATAWAQRFGVTHLVFKAPGPRIPGAILLLTSSDPALDAIVYQSSDQRRRTPSTWTVIRLPVDMPSARVASRVNVVPDFASLRRWMASQPEGSDETCVIAADLPPGVSAPEAGGSGRVVWWDGRQAIVEHEGPCLLVIPRTYYPGWAYSIEDGPPQSMARVENGLQGIWLDGSGSRRISTFYQPTGFRVLLGASIVGLLMALSLLVIDLARCRSTL